MRMMGAVRDHDPLRVESRRPHQPKIEPGNQVTPTDKLSEPMMALAIQSTRSAYIPILGRSSDSRAIQEGFTPSIPKRE